MTFGDRIKYVRGDLTQKEFANKLGVSLGAIQHWEAQDQMPKGDILLRFIQIFQININWLLSGEGEPNLSQQNSPKNVIDIQHNEIIGRFNDKQTAKEINEDLLFIEKANKTIFRETGTYIKGVANTLKVISRDDVGEQAPAATVKKEAV